MMKYLIAVLAVLLVACAPAADTTAPEPTAPPTEEVVPAAPDAALVDPGATEVNKDMRDNVFADEFRESMATNDVLAEEDVRCDGEERALQFRFRNPTDQDWKMDNKLPFPAPSGVKGVQILVNGYEVKDTETFVQGETMFGPGVGVPANCNDVETLAPGEEVTCFLQPIPIRLGGTLGAGDTKVQGMTINAAGISDSVKFTCE